MKHNRTQFIVKAPRALAVFVHAWLVRRACSRTHPERSRESQAVLPVFRLLPLNCGLCALALALVLGAGIASMSVGMSGVALAQEAQSSATKRKPASRRMAKRPAKKRTPRGKRVAREGDVTAEAPASHPEGPAMLGVSWSAYSPEGYGDLDKQLHRYEQAGFRMVTMVPTYTYGGYNSIDFSKAPTWEGQKAAMVALLRGGYHVVYKPHLDPPLYQPGFQMLESDNHSWRAGCPWRGYFDVDPMTPDYRDKIVLRGLQLVKDAFASLNAEEQKAAHPVRVELGSELMNSVVYAPERWVALLQDARRAVEDLGVKDQVRLSHNFSHHFAIVDDFVGRMDSARKQHLRRYLLGLDAVALSQYMDLTVTVPADERERRLPKPEEVASALRRHEHDLRHEVLERQLDIPVTQQPAFHLGEFGIGRGGLRHPNVWSGSINGEQAQRLRSEIIIGMQGLVQYLRQPGGREAQTAVLWVLGQYYDFFGWMRDTNSVDPARDAVVQYLKETAAPAKR